MKMNENKIISLHVPAQIILSPDFKTENNLITVAKLKVFYIGMTPDKRLFTEKFSKKLLQSIPQAPVVAYYDKDDEDFKGHNTEQYVYGYVPDNPKFDFEEVDGQVWAVTEVNLFTGRKDNIGDVAAKIVGKSQSLELDPDTFKYKINRDNNGKFESFELTDGRISGLSVLGDDQEPAFTGSHFFQAQELDLSALIEKFKDVKASLDLTVFSDKTNKNKQDGGVEMNLEQFSSTTLVELNNFMKETYDEKLRKVYDAALNAFGDIYPVQIGEDAIVFYDYSTGKQYRTNYAVEGEEFVFGDKVEVKARYLTEEEINAIFTVNESNEIESFNIVGSIIDNNVTYSVLPKAVAKQEIAVINNYSEQSEFPSYYITDETGGWVNTTTTDFTNDLVGVRYVPLELYKQLQGAQIEQNNKTDQEEKPEGIFFTQGEKEQIDADRAELETFRRTAKQELITKYEKFLTVEQVAEFNESIDKFKVEELEIKLSSIAMRKVFELQEQEKAKEGKNFSFGVVPKVEKTETGDELKDLINQYK